MDFILDYIPDNWIDILAGVTVLLSVLFGYIRGFVREILAFTTWVGALVIADLTFNWNSGWIGSQFDLSGNLLLLVAGVGVFIVLVIVFSLFAAPLWRRVRASTYWLIDSFIGLFWGFARAVLILAVIWVALAWPTQRAQRLVWLENNVSVGAIDDTTRIILGWVKALPHRTLQDESMRSLFSDIDETLGEPLRTPPDLNDFIIPQPTAVPTVES